MFSEVVDGGSCCKRLAWLNAHAIVGGTFRLLVGVTCTSAATTTCFPDAASMNDCLCGSSSDRHNQAANHACWMYTDVMCA